MYCTTSDGGAARFRGIASVGKQATSDTGNCGRRENTRDLEAPCNSLPFPGIRSTPGRVTYSGFLTLLGSGSPEFRSQARGSGSPTHCHPSMSGEDTPTSIPPLGSPESCAFQGRPARLGVFHPVCRSRRLPRFFRHLVDALRERCSHNEACSSRSVLVVGP